MSSFAERQEVAQRLARTHVFHAVAATAEKRHTHSSTIYGLQVAAEIIGLTHQQLMAIEETAVNWAAENCPGMALDPPKCSSTCPSACEYVPLAARTHR
jgi:hypothetical protein